MRYSVNDVAAKAMLASASESGCWTRTRKAVVAAVCAVTLKRRSETVAKPRRERLPAATG